MLAPHSGNHRQSLQEPEAISRDVRWREYKNTDRGRCSILTCCQQLRCSCISLQQFFHYRPLDATHRLSSTCGEPFPLAAVKHCNPHPSWLVQLWPAIFLSCTFVFTLPHCCPPYFAFLINLADLIATPVHASFPWPRSSLQLLSLSPFHCSSSPYFRRES